MQLQVQNQIFFSGRAMVSALPPGQATNPTPANGATGVDATTEEVFLSWTAAPGQVTNYRLQINGVFFDSTPNTSYLLPDVLPNTLYTWRLDAVGPGGTTIGTVWNFTTAPLQNTLVTTWLASVAGQGGAAPSVNTQAVVNIFCNSLASAGLTSKIHLLHIFAPDNLITCLTPLVGPNPTNHGFTLAAVSVNGLTGNSSSWLNSNYAPATDLVWPSGGMSSYSLVPIGAPNFVVDAGVSQAHAPYQTLYTWSWDAGGAFFTTVATMNEITVTTAPVKGFYSGNRTSTTNAKMYQASSAVAFNTLGSYVTAAAGTAWPTHNSYIFGYNSVNGSNVDGILSIMNWPLSFHAIHDGFDATQAQNLYNAVQALRVALGGGYN